VKFLIIIKINKCVCGRQHSKPKRTYLAACLFLGTVLGHSYVCTIYSASSTQQDDCHFIIAAKEVGRVEVLLKKNYSPVLRFRRNGQISARRHTHTYMQVVDKKKSN